MIVFGLLSLSLFCKLSVVKVDFEIKRMNSSMIYLSIKLQQMLNMS